MDFCDVLHLLQEETFMGGESYTIRQGWGRSCTPRLRECGDGVARLGSGEPHQARLGQELSDRSQAWECGNGASGEALVDDTLKAGSLLSFPGTHQDAGFSP